MTDSNLITPDFTEDIVSMMIQIMLTIPRLPRAPFALIPLSKRDEVIYGADAWIESISPLYLQFKRSFAYPDFSTSKIIKDRKQLQVSYSPRTLFFNLREKQPAHNDFQHNVLFDLNEKLENAGCGGKAFYVAPLFLNRAVYLSSVHWASLLAWRPWYWFMDEPFSRQDQMVITQTGSLRFHNIPILAQHIAIPPHEKVNTHKHRYSYLENGKDICFHNPKKFDSEQTLGRLLYEFMKFSDGQPTTSMINLKDSMDTLRMLQNGLFDSGISIENHGTIDGWVDFGEKLRNNYDIFQFMLIKLKE